MLKKKETYYKMAWAGVMVFMMFIFGAEEKAFYMRYFPIGTGTTLGLGAGIILAIILGGIGIATGGIGIGIGKLGIIITTTLFGVGSGSFAQVLFNPNNYDFHFGIIWVLFSLWLCGHLLIKWKAKNEFRFV